MMTQDWTILSLRRGSNYGDLLRRALWRCQREEARERAGFGRSGGEGKYDGDQRVGSSCHGMDTGQENLCSKEDLQPARGNVLTPSRERVF